MSQGIDIKINQSNKGIHKNENMNKKSIPIKPKKKKLITDDDEDEEFIPSNEIEQQYFSTINPKSMTSSTSNIKPTINKKADNEKPYTLINPKTITTTTNTKPLYKKKKLIDSDDEEEQHNNKEFYGKSPDGIKINVINNNNIKKTQETQKKSINSINSKNIANSEDKNKLNEFDSLVIDTTNIKRSYRSSKFRRKKNDNANTILPEQIKTPEYEFPHKEIKEEKVIKPDETKESDIIIYANKKFAYKNNFINYYNRYPNVDDINKEQNEQNFRKTLVEIKNNATYKTWKLEEEDFENFKKNFKNIKENDKSKVKVNFPDQIEVIFQRNDEYLMNFVELKNSIKYYVRIGSLPDALVIMNTFANMYRDFPDKDDKAAWLSRKSKITNFFNNLRIIAVEETFNADAIFLVDQEIIKFQMDYDIKHLYNIAICLCLCPKSRIWCITNEAPNKNNENYPYFDKEYNNKDIITYYPNLGRVFGLMKNLNENCENFYEDYKNDKNNPTKYNEVIKILIDIYDDKYSGFNDRRLFLCAANAFAYFDIEHDYENAIKHVNNIYKKLKLDFINIKKIQEEQPFFINNNYEGINNPTGLYNFIFYTSKIKNPVKHLHTEAMEDFWRSCYIKKMAMLYGSINNVKIIEKSNSTVDCVNKAKIFSSINSLTKQSFMILDLLKILKLPIFKSYDLLLDFDELDKKHKLLSDDNYIYQGPYEINNPIFEKTVVIRKNRTNSDFFLKNKFIMNLVFNMIFKNNMENFFIFFDKDITTNIFKSYIIYKKEKVFDEPDKIKFISNYSNLNSFPPKIILNLLYLASITGFNNIDFNDFLIKDIEKEEYILLFKPEIIIDNKQTNIYCGINDQNQKNFIKNNLKHIVSINDFDKILKNNLIKLGIYDTLVKNLKKINNSLIFKK